MTATTSSPEIIYIFIPGIMGSSLRYKGTGTYGQPVDEEIWGGDVTKIERLLGLNPEYLTASNVEPGEVIRQFSFGWLSKRDFYGPLISYLTNPKPAGMGLIEGNNYFSFAYDWRADNQETAERLTQFIRNSIPNKEATVRIIAHSMGGIVARLMLLSATDVAQRTDRLFQIASPLEGSTKAYYSLKMAPRIHWLLDKVWRFFHSLKPERRHRLLLALQQCYSLYQLLPPQDIQVLRNHAGEKYSAMDNGVWASVFNEHVERAKQVHSMLRKKLPQSIKYIYSSCHETEADYIVDQFFNYQAIQEPQANGDGTVIAASAIALSERSDRILIEGPFELTNHDSLCQNTRVFDELKTHMF